MSNQKRKQLTGRGPVGKTAVVGLKDRQTNEVRAQVVEDTTAKTLQGYVLDNTQLVYTDDARPYSSLKNHETVRHSGIRQGSGSHQWRRVVLVDAQKGAHWNFP